MPKSIGELLESFFAGKLNVRAPREAQILEAWQRLMGSEIAQATSFIRLRKKSCQIGITDPLLREELRYQAPRLGELLRAAGFPDLKKIEIVNG